jgi:hypothetical protein
MKFSRTALLSLYSYQQDELTKPRRLLTKRRSSSLPQNIALFTATPSLSVLSLSLSDSALEEFNKGNSWSRGYHVCSLDE